MAKCQDPIESVEYHRMIDHTIIVKFSQVFEFGNSALIEFEVVLFQTKNDRLQNIIDHSNDELLVISV